MPADRRTMRGLAFLLRPLGMDDGKGAHSIKTPQTPPAASSLPTEAKGGVLTATTTTTSGTISLRLNPAPPVDPLETVEYESWMFLATCDLALNHWNGLPNKVYQHAIVEDAVLHARSLCEVFVGPAKKDTITLKDLFPGLDQDAKKYKALREAKGMLEREYNQTNGRTCTYRELFNTRVMHPTVLRGSYGLYEEPLRRLQPKILAVIREIESLEPKFKAR